MSIPSNRRPNYILEENAQTINNLIPTTKKLNDEERLMPWVTERHIISEASSIKVALLSTSNNTDKNFLTFE